MTSKTNLLTLTFLSLCPSINAMHLTSVGTGQTCPSHSELPFIQKFKINHDDKQICILQNQESNKNIQKKTTIPSKKNDNNKIPKRTLKERKLAEQQYGKTKPMAYASLSDLLKALDFSQPLTPLQFQTYMQLALNVTYRTDVKDPNSLIAQWMNEHVSQDSSTKTFRQLLRAVKKNKSIKLNKETQHAYRMIEELHSCLKKNIKRRKELRGKDEKKESWSGGEVLILDSTKAPVVDLKINKETPINDNYYNSKSIPFTECSSDISTRPMTHTESFLQILVIMGTVVVAFGFVLAHG